VHSSRLSGEIYLPSCFLQQAEVSFHNAPSPARLPGAGRGARGLLYRLCSAGPLTLVVARDPLHSLSKSHFSSNQVSENSDLIRKTQSDWAVAVLSPPFM
jgi:hypothetical protein